MKPYRKQIGSFQAVYKFGSYYVEIYYKNKPIDIIASVDGLYEESESNDITLSYERFLEIVQDFIDDGSLADYESEKEYL